MTTSIRPQSKKRNLWQHFVRLQNPFMKWLLKSRLHFMVSQSYMLLNVTGRKSGKLYSTPVQYFQQGHVLVVITRRDYQWWRNLIGGAETTVQLRGKLVTGYATISLNPDVMINVLGKMYSSMAFEAREKFADNGVVIYVTLDE